MPRRTIPSLKNKGQSVAFKFVHTADIHLDSPLKSLAMREQGLADLVGNATRQVLRRIVDLCLSEQVQALVIAGDLYDGAQTSMKTARFLAQEMRRLDEAGVEVYLIRGNHDAMSKITTELELPSSVKVFGGRAEVVSTNWNGHPVAVHGISFRQPHAPDSLLPKFKAPVAGAFNLGILHTSLGGAAGHDLYAPCTLPDLQAMGFDYWALGHIHVRKVYEGQTTVVMPGIPQGRDIGEAGQKSVTLVSVADNGEMTLSERCLGAAQFERVDLPCDGIELWSDLLDALQRTIRQARRDFEAEHLILRIDVRGASSLYWRARRDQDLLFAEAQVVAEQLGTVWIDKIELGLKVPEATPPVGAVGELLELLEQEGPSDGRADYAALRRHLPTALRGMFGDDEAQEASGLTKLAQQGAQDILSRLETDS